MRPTRGGVESLPPYLIHQRLEVINVFKTAVHTGKAHVGHFVELLQLAHYQFPDAGRGNLSQPQVEQLFLNTLDGAVNLLRAHRALAQRQVERGQ